MSPIIERTIVQEGDFTQSGNPLIKREAIHRTYVKPSKVKDGDVVVGMSDREVIEERAFGKKKRIQRSKRTIAKLTDKELTDPRVRADAGLEPLDVEDEDDDAPSGVRTIEQDEEEDEDEEIDDDMEEALISEPGDSVSLLEQFVTAPRYQDAIALIEKHAGTPATIAEFAEAENRRSKPRPSVVAALTAAGGV